MVDFRSADQLADATLRILDDPFLKRTLERNAYEYGHEAAWPRVGERMMAVLSSAAAESASRPLSRGLVSDEMASVEAPLSSERVPVLTLA